MKHLVYLIPLIAVLSYSCQGSDLSSVDIEKLSQANAEATRMNNFTFIGRADAAEKPVQYFKRETIGTDTNLSVRVSIPALNDSAVAATMFIDPVHVEDQMKALTEMTGGFESYVRGAADVTDKVIEIIDGNIEDNTDIILLIDCTSSMGDDIDNVKVGCNNIIAHVRTKKNARIGVVQYRDRADGNQWFQYIPLSSNFDFVKSYIAGIMVSGGGSDIPESMYDAAVLAMDTMEWRETSKKMMLVIGDAPSLVPPMSTFGLQDVVDKSAEHGVEMNFYPVIISPVLAESHTAVVDTKPMVANIYPNPTAGELTIEMCKEDDYSWDVMNTYGDILFTDQGMTNKIHVDLTQQAAGTYIVRIRDLNGNRFEDKRIVVTR